MNAVQIYLLGEPDNRRIKIGISKNAKVRQKQHETRGPDDVEMVYLGSWWGMPSDEHYLKEYFKDLAIPNRKEWFMSNPGEDTLLRPWVSEMLKQPFVARGEEDIHSKPFIDSHLWRPVPPERVSQCSLPLDLPSSDAPWSDVLTTKDIDPHSKAFAAGDFYSPKVIVDVARLVFGGTIDLDPASCRQANGVVLAKRYYSYIEDGLKQPWFGNVWLNPPYGKWELWAEKLIYELPNIKQAIAICETRVTTAKMFQPIVCNCSAILKLCGRHRFWGPNAKSPDEGHELYYFGKNVDIFEGKFRHLGTAFVRAKS